MTCDSIMNENSKAIIPSRHRASSKNSIMYKSTHHRMGK